MRWHGDEHYLSHTIEMSKMYLDSLNSKEASKFMKIQASKWGVDTNLNWSAHGCAQLVQI
jgi:hypothetical protein